MAAVSRATRQRVLPLTVALIAVAAVAGYVATYTHYLDIHAFAVVRSDGLGYYAYLPAWLIEHDGTLRTFVAEHAGAHPDWFGILQMADGRYVDRYGIGEAAMLLPFFLIGHLIAQITGLNANGFSGPEQVASGLGGVVYMVTGIAVLGGALRRRFSGLVSALTLVAITFGSDLFHYGTFDSMFSHAFSFFLVACLLVTAPRWYAGCDRILPSLSLGLNLGLIALVRLPNAIFVLVPLLYGVTNTASLRARVAWFCRHWSRIVLVAAVAIAAFLPQLAVWKLETGSWLVYAYGSAGFDFRHPQIINALFSFGPHGFLPWAPVMALALGGVVVMRQYTPELLWPLLSTFVVFTVLIASWGSPTADWFYGGGYGDRAFVDIFPLLAFGLAALFARVPAGMPRRALATAAATACGLATLQMLHYWRLIIPLNGVTFSQYIHLLPRRFW